MNLTLICFSAGLVVLSSLFLLRKKSSDPYGLFHLELNRLDDDTSEPTTEWLNMGYWKETTKFPAACEALAVKLTLQASENCKGKVLDVGYGTGESILQLLRMPAESRPTRIRGITSVSSHHLRSVRRVDAFLDQASDADVQLDFGDAVFRPSAPPGHPLDPGSDEGYNLIRALDCAYHFDSRMDFCLQAFHKLEPDGQLVLADICFDSAALENPFKAFMISVIRVMPSKNAVSKQQYISGLQKIGFRDVDLEDISHDVFPGFTTFLKSRGGGWQLFGWTLEQYHHFLGAKFVIVRGTRI